MPDREGGTRGLPDTARRQDRSRARRNAGFADGPPGHRRSSRNDDRDGVPHDFDAQERRHGGGSKLARDCPERHGGASRAGRRELNAMNIHEAATHLMPASVPALHPAADGTSIMMIVAICAILGGLAASMLAAWLHVRLANEKRSAHSAMRQADGQ